MPRKIFNFDDLDQSKTVDGLMSPEIYKNTISAAGCLIYKQDENDEVYLLLIKYTDCKSVLLDDFGGKIDDIDESVFDTITRELKEETNGVIERKNIINKIIKNNFKFFHQHYSKYFSILIKVNSDFYPDPKVFDELEYHDNIKRTVGWYKFNDCHQELAHRIKNNISLMEYLNNLQKN